MKLLYLVVEWKNSENFKTWEKLFQRRNFSYSIFN